MTCDEWRAAHALLIGVQELASDTETSSALQGVLFVIPNLFRKLLHA